MKTIIFVILSSAVLCSLGTAFPNEPAYFGLLPAQIAHYELVGIDLYLDTLQYIATLAIAIALTLPLTQVDIKEVFSAIFDLVEY